MRVNALLAVIPLASVTCAVKVNGPVAVGVPEMTPLLDPSANPGGRLPERIDQEYGVTPPVAATVVVYGVFNVPLGIIFVVITGAPGLFAEAVNVASTALQLVLALRVKVPA